MSPRYVWGWTRPSLVCGIKWKCLAAGGIEETPRIRLFRGGSARTKANKGVIRICPFVLPPALKAMFPTLMPKKAPIYFSGRSRIGTIHIGADKIQRWLMKSSLFSTTRRFHRFERDMCYARCNAYPLTIILLYPRKLKWILSSLSKMDYHVQISQVIIHLMLYII